MLFSYAACMHDTVLVDGAVTILPYPPLFVLPWWVVFMFIVAVIASLVLLLLLYYLMRRKKKKPPRRLYSVSFTLTFNRNIIHNLVLVKIR